MEKSILYLTIKIINQKKAMTTNKVQYYVGSFSVNFGGLNVLNV